ncbi:MAG: AzlD domain-containing protein [Acidimicrobiales bacterium]
MNVWLAMTLVGVGTYLFRSSMILARDRFGELHWLEQRLTYVGPSVLAAIVAAALFTQDGVRTAPSGPALAAVLAGFLAVRRTGNVGAALAVGLPIYWVGAALGLS